MGWKDAIEDEVQGIRLRAATETRDAVITILLDEVRQIPKGEAQQVIDKVVTRLLTMPLTRTNETL